MLDRSPPSNDALAQRLANAEAERMLRQETEATGGQNGATATTTAVTAEVIMEEGEVKTRRAPEAERGGGGGGVRNGECHDLCPLLNLT